MRLLRARVRNYRVHEDIDVRFDARTSLLGGLNEAGKSTLVEAIHRALFLPAKGNTQVHKTMQREGVTDKPEVRLEFEHRGQSYELLKHFARTASAAVTLRRSGQPTLEGDEAEAYLADLTGATLPEGKRATDETARMPWSHLWVWQGAAGDQPTAFIEGITDELVKITAQGAGAVLMSEVDSQLAARFRENHEGTYGTGNGRKARKGSALGQSETTHTECSDEVDELEAKVAALGADADRYAAAQARLTEAEPKSEQVTEELAALAKAIASARGVEAERNRTRERHLSIRREADVLRAGHQQLGEWDAAIAALTAQLAGDARAAELAETRAAASRRQDEADEAVAKARARLKPLAAQQDRAGARARLLRARADLEQAETNAARVAGLERELAVVDERLARLPEIPDSKIPYLREREGLLQNLRAQLAAVTSTLRVLRTRAPLTLDGRPLAEGQQADLTAASVIEYGEELSLKLVVPGVADAEALRADIAEKEEAMAKYLAQFVIEDTVATSVDELAAVIPRRAALAAQRKQLERQLKSERAPETKQALTTARQRLVAEETNDRDAVDFEGWPDPQDLPSVEALEQEYAEAYRRQEDVISALARELKEATAARKSAKTQEAAYAKTRRADEDALLQASTQRDTLLRPHGGKAEVYLKALTDKEAEEGTADRAAKAAQAALDEVALDVLEGRHARLTDQRKRLRATVEAARDAMSEARGRLHQEDGSDPDAALRDARERLRRARADCARETLDAEATALLHELFQEEIDAANERVTQPLAEKVGEYLRRMYGPKAEVKLRYAEGKFEEFYLVRPGFAAYEEPFGSLSGGAREQVAAAVRLATAELLAEGYGGTLPVVFDDAFVNTDPSRIESVIDMLYHAGDRGLQVIVSTCDPGRYENIGQVQWKVNRGGGAEVV